ncbi:ectoine/hydroxyectoine ABC transporter permease subunit EhuC [Saccharomonospora azurea]|uniref:Ectoine/hydroxyectoine ABC transporter, permease protein EhuC n=1 Tax=Saccharomonospora azurea NA-128 TaxID=882081 RepID=H8GAU0_9PSEU|nr:ectoine/hydroxyectoine ABC transporter permease subunit EhuC [Saccharomonospora azurea]EHK87186.1 amino acid ABC transporter membrane protein [Saccharomonospora azurea SZMC 14600]EHY88626.1 ectoine/hydroxyectoine ABC transporter, permease protein EhuC [Saccharomonospora azurea NA-128]
MFDDVPHFVSVIADGLLVTVQATVGGIILATVLSFVAGLAILSHRVAVRTVARVYIEIWRGTSEVVQLFWLYFVLPVLTGFQLLPLWAGILVLGLNFGAYGAEIVRGSVQSVPKEQHEGGVALNFSSAQRLRRIILPQALVEMVPPFNNLFIQLLKGTALLTFITVPEMTHQATVILVPAFTSEVALIFTLLLLFYLVLSIVITFLMRLLERWAARKVGRTPAKRDQAVATGGGVA